MRRASHVHQMPHAARAPEHSGEQADAGVDDRYLGRGDRYSVRGERLEWVAAPPVEIAERGHEVDVGEEQLSIDVGTW